MIYLNMIQYNEMQYDTIQYNTIRYNTIQYNTYIYIHIYIMYVCAIIHGHGLKHMFGGSRGDGDHIHICIRRHICTYLHTYACHIFV